jgi:hypothetical protein
MHRVPVESSNIVSVGYAEKARTLEIEFRSGAVYRYFEVEPEVHEALLHAASKGRFFMTSIRGAYPFERV